MSFDLASVDHVLTTTRSVRKRLDLERDVPRDLVLECLRVASQAPTGGNAQGWRWVVVTDGKKRAAIGEIYAEIMGHYFALMAPLAAGNAQQERVVSSARHLVDVLPGVPVHVIPCVLGRPEVAAQLLQTGFPYDVPPNCAASGIYGSIWPAVWSFMLAARARGVGSALTTMHLAREREVGELLGIPDTVTQIGLLPVAWFTGSDFKPAKRRPAEEITYWDGWKAR